MLELINHPSRTVHSGHVHAECAFCDDKIDKILTKQGSGAAILIGKWERGQIPIFPVFVAFKFASSDATLEFSRDLSLDLVWLEKDEKIVDHSAVEVTHDGNTKHGSPLFFPSTKEITLPVAQSYQTASTAVERAYFSYVSYSNVPASNMSFLITLEDYSKLPTNSNGTLKLDVSLVLTVSNDTAFANKSSLIDLQSFIHYTFLHARIA